MWTLEDFVRESNRIEGINRDPTQEEIIAHEILIANKEVTIKDLEAFVSIIQPGAVLRNKIGLDVRVGNYYPPLGGPEIKFMLQGILDIWIIIGGYKTHIAYEKLHPFTDGNGRSERSL